MLSAENFSKQFCWCSIGFFMRPVDLDPIWHRWYSSWKKFLKKWFWKKSADDKNPKDIPWGKEFKKMKLRLDLPCESLRQQSSVKQFTCNFEPCSLPPFVKDYQKDYFYSWSFHMLILPMFFFLCWKCHLLHLRKKSTWMSHLLHTCIQIHSIKSSYEWAICCIYSNTL